MSKTFDNISEAAATNYLFLFAQRTLGLQEEPPTPPPLNALGLPCEAICRLWAWLCPKKAAARRHLCVYLKSIGAMGKAVKAAVEERAAAKAAAEKAVADNTAISLEPGDTTSKVTAAAFDFAKKIAPLVEKVTEYIQDHQDDAAQEDRWRTTMKRDMGKSFRLQRKAIDTQRDEVQKLHAKMDEVQEVQKVEKEVRSKVDEKLDRIAKDLARLTAVRRSKKEVL
eukprot:scaffold18562_cov63-Phaeocystis_antarctica.AAC.1